MQFPPKEKIAGSNPVTSIKFEVKGGRRVFKSYINKNKELIIGLVLGIIIVSILGRATIVGNSMENNYHDGNTVIVDKQIYKFVGINRGNVIITNKLDVLNKRIIKRVIGIPGDIIEIKDNELFVNNTEVKEKYIKEKMNTSDIKIELDSDEYFVLGDNRNDSLDSRVIGAIKGKDIYGVVIAKLNTNLNTEKLINKD